MPETISEILVEVGDEIKTDEELVILEAMKMQNPIYADSSGVVKENKVKQDNEVEEGQVLLVLK